MKSITFTPPHPIIFIGDYDNLDAEIPIYDPECLASSTDTCISIGTIASVDGDVAVTLASTIPEGVLDSYAEVFSDNIDVPSSRLAVFTSEDQKLVEMAVSSSTIHVRVFVDDEASPRHIWVVSQEGEELS
jgi:hypothetical protein